jgi:nicotinamide-nucleotide amidase
MLVAEIIAIGSELLMPQFRDTNSLYLTEQLNAIGIPVKMKTIVGDEENYLEHAVRGAMDRTSILIVPLVASTH